MNKTLVSRLVVGALAAMAAGGVMAGQIQSSSTPIAREVITADDQNIVSPQVAYRFFGDISAVAQEQVFQVQFTLSGGQWVGLPGNEAFAITDGTSGVVQDQTAGAPAAGIAASYQVVGKGLANGNRTLWVTFAVTKSATATIRQPIISVNTTDNTINGVALTNVSAQRNEINQLYSVVGDIVKDYEGTAGANDSNFGAKCVDNKEIKVDVKHFNALANPGALAVADGNGTPDEHMRAGSTNTGTLFAFPTNVKVNVKQATGGVRLSPAGSTQFQLKTPGEAFVSPVLANMGNITLAQNAQGHDANLTIKYMLNDPSAPPGVKGRTTAIVNDGPLEVKHLVAKVYASDGFVPGGKIFLSSQVNCSDNGGETAITTTNAAGPISVSLQTASVNPFFGPAGTSPVYVCYEVPGTTAIPSSNFWVRAQLDKADPGPNVYEQDNVCNGPLFGLGGGLKIDVRNYAPAASVAGTGWMSVIRLINNSDSSPADVWAQIIHQDGRVGKWGKIAQLPVRAVANLTSKELEAKLTEAPAAPGGDKTNDGSAAAVRDVEVTAAPRLRITSTTGKSLRVQNYVVNTIRG